MYYVIVYEVKQSDPGIAKIVQVMNSKGPQEEFLVPHQAIKTIEGKATIFVGGALTSDDNSFLFEFPVESLRGNSRVWVPKKEALSESMEAA